MQKRAFFWPRAGLSAWFFSWFLIFSCLFQAASARAQGAPPAVTAIYYFSTFLGQTNTVRRLFIVPDHNVPSQWGASVFPVQPPIFLTLGNTPGLANGIFVTNLAVGQAYDVQISDGYLTYFYTNYFPLSDSNTTVNAWNRQGFYNGVYFAYVSPVVSNLVFNAGANFTVTSTNASTGGLTISQSTNNVTGLVSFDLGIPWAPQGGSGPYTRTLSAVAGDNAQIQILQNLGEEFFDAAGTRQATVSPLGLTGNIPYAGLASNVEAGINITNATFTGGNGSGLTDVNAATLGAAPAINFQQGYWSNIVYQVTIPNTNQLWPHGAGTSTVNNEMVLAGPFETGGLEYTSIVTSAGSPVAYACSQFGGTTVSPNFDQQPFYIGPSTNNYSLFTAAGGYQYFSALGFTAYWTNNNNYLDGSGGTGANPPPTVTYGTNFINVTNTAWISPGTFTYGFSNNIIYVSSLGGNDLLASNLLCAFATCQAAKKFAQAGDLIEVGPGYYQDHDLLKNGVNWNFQKGSTVAWDDPRTDASPRSIFDDYAGAVTSNITGDRLHYTEIAPVEWPAIFTTNPATRLTLNFNTADYAFFAAPTTSDATPGAPPPPANGVYCMQVSLDVNDQYLELDFNTVNGYTNAPRQLLDANTGDIPGDYGTYVSVTNVDGGFGWQQGEEHINLKSLVDTNGGGSYAFESDNGGSAETSVFLNADYINGFAYWEDTNPNARTWLDIGYFQAGIPPSIGSGTALRYYGQAINYYRGLKVSGYGNAVIDTGGATYQFFLWADIQKVTQNGNGPWLNLSGPCSTWFDVLYFEDNSGGIMPEGFTISGGTNFITGSDIAIKSATNAPAILVTGGLTTISASTITSIGTNADIALRANNALTLQEDVLHSSNNVAAISATAPVTLAGTFQADVPPTNIATIAGINYSSTNSGFFSGTMAGNGTGLTGIPISSVTTNGPAVGVNGDALMQTNSGYVPVPFPSGPGAGNFSTNTPLSIGYGTWLIETNSAGGMIISNAVSGGTPLVLTTNNTVTMAGGTNTGNLVVQGTMAGNGSGLTNLNASALLTGTVPSSVLSNLILTNGWAGGLPTVSNTNFTQVASIPGIQYQFFNDGWFWIGFFTQGSPAANSNLLTITLNTAYSTNAAGCLLFPGWPSYSSFSNTESSTLSPEVRIQAITTSNTVILNEINALTGSQQYSLWGMLSQHH